MVSSHAVFFDPSLHVPPWVTSRDVPDIGLRQYRPAQLLAHGMKSRYRAGRSLVADFVGVLYASPVWSNVVTQSGGFQQRILF